MFKEIFLFEMKQWLKRPAIYIYFLIFFVVSFLLGAAISGLFSGVNADTNTHVNAPSVIAGILTSFNSDYLLGLITILICVALMAGSVQKDFQYNCFSFYFTKPISKSDYLWGRFSASFLLTVLVLTSIVLGLWISYSLAPNDNGQLGEFRFMSFFQPFIYILIPNAFLIGTVFFSLVTFSRNMTSGYVGSLIFIVVAGIARTITGDLDNKGIAALLDPMGQQALSVVTEYWTPAEVNERLLPFSGYLLYNRLIWLGISAALLAFTFIKFDFNQFLNPVSLFAKKKKERTSQPSKLIQSIGHLPAVTQVFDGKLAWEQIKFLTRFEFRKITRSPFFFIILGLSILLTILISQFSGLIYGTKTYPLTYMQIETGSGIFRFFLLILIIFYSGIVIWRERDSKVDELVGATPVGNFVLFVSKFSSLLFLCLAVNVVCMITCILIQSYSGYYNYEIDLYLTDLLGLKSISLFALIALALSIQVYFANRYFAYFTMVLIVLGLPLVYSSFKYNNDLLEFNSSGDMMMYSDMNGHGHTLPGFFVYKFYWIGFTLILSSLAIAMYQRGKEKNFRPRLMQALRNYKPSYKAVFILGALFFLGCGSVIYYNTRVLHPYRSPKDAEKQMAEFEKQYKKYQKEIQPRVVESNLQIDIFPDQLGCKIKGHYYLKNKHKTTLDKVFLNINREAGSRSIAFSTPSELFLKDSMNGFYGYKLKKGLLPGDSVKLDFYMEYFPKNFIIKQDQSEIVYNGSFFNSGMLPSIGYNQDAELFDNTTRKKYKLDPKPRMASINDTNAYKNNYISNDADWIRFECVLSTKEGQTAIAPGYLIKDWKGKLIGEDENSRHFFHYKMNAPILNFYAFLSAEYQIKRDKWIDPQNAGNVVNIEIYHHKGHEYNIDRMIQGIKKSLDYYTKNFSPYQHKQVRILEFPRYASFAQSFPNTIPFSESIGFVAKMDTENPEEVDYTFYVTAHEVAHQWWAHQVMGANCQGSTLMSETMSQYSALMVMEKEYGQAAMRKFLKYEMNNYLGGRAGESKKEVPLLLCENQQYIHYNKGSVVMYALKDYLGEDSLNAALRKYIKKVAFQEPPYTNANEFYSFITAATPDSLKETVKDLFERIVVFDNKVKKWSYEKTKDGKYKITAELQCQKSRSDSIGKAKEVALNDWIDIGVFTENVKHPTLLGETIYMKKVKVDANEKKIELIVDKEPFMFGVDPLNKLIDKNAGDNSKDKNGKDIGGGVEPGGTTVQVKAEG